MKGTAVRDHDPERDAALATELARDAKQRAENLMIVDLLRNDLSRVARAGSVTVPDLFKVETYPTVHQMVSTIRGRVLPGLAPVDVLRVLFPCGSITGAPKVRAMEIIDMVEPFARGVYTGAMGWMDPAGDAAFNVAIRTICVEEGSGIGRLGLGSGIVADSDASAEWAECLAKGRFLSLG
jgi:anthranilate/para-aminobenzoate synthase component I